jgi:tetratricopeptide (TPR) repeat protein
VKSIQIFRKFFFLVFICAPLVNQGQENKADSLETLLSHAPARQKPAILNQLAELHKRDTTKSFYYGKEALKLARQEKNTHEVILALKNIAIAFGYSNQYKNALQYLLQSYSLALEKREWDIAGDNSLNIGTVYYVVFSDYATAVDYYLQALKHFEKTRNRKGIASALLGLGISYQHEKKFDLALENLFKSLSIYEELAESREVPKVHVNIGSTYKDMNDLAKAKKHLALSIKGFEDTKNERGKAHALYATADFYRSQKLFSQAIGSLEEALALNEKSNHKNSIIDCELMLGRTYLEMDKLDEAKKHLEHAAALAKEILKSESLSSAYELLSKIEQEQKNFASAFNYLSLHKALHDSIFTEKKSQQIAEMQARFETENKEKEIVLLKQEKALNQTYLFIAITVLVSMGIIGFLIINWQTLKLKTEREIAEKESQLMEERKTLYEAELRNRELAEKHLHDQLEFKNKELATYTLNLIQKNEILEDIKKSVDEIRNSPEAQIKQKLNALVNMVNYSFNLDKDWESFKMHFEQVHQNFFKRLLELYPELSANDLKLCSLIKLNLDNRGIAAILNISQESAKVAKHRLRKKLDIPAEQTLIAFFNSIETQPEPILQRAANW